jgi:UDP-N-acetylmuramoyl-L-alanyl-D-glutamate--2,6-diaminopimelate ligase
MKLSEILHNLDIENIRGDGNIAVTGVTHDSRNVADHFLFVAIDGFRRRGTEFVGDAVKSGAVAVVSSSPPMDVQPPVTWVTVRNPRAALSKISANFYGKPTEKMRIIGITGTSGKTTSCYLVFSIFEAAGIPGGLMGTIEVRRPTIFTQRPVPCSRPARP